MEKMRKRISNLFWLYKPYWKYGKSFVLLSLAFWTILVPICRILMVIFPEKMVSALETGWDWKQIVLLVIYFQIALLAIPTFENVYIHIFRDKTQAKIGAKIKEEIYQQVLKTDYKYIDDPKYYEKYKWAIEHQVEKVNEAFSLINSALSALMIISSLVTIISTFNPIIVVLTVMSMIIRTIGYMKYNQYDVRREEELIEKERKLDYFHRIFYLREYNADLKSTALKDIVLRKYKEEIKSKIDIIKGFAWKLLRWALFSDLVYRVAMAIIILMIADSIYSGNILQAGTYITIMLSVEKLEDYMYEFFELFQKSSKLSMYAEDIRAFYKIESKIEISEIEVEQNTIPEGAFGVDIENVAFSYDNSRFTIEDLNIHVKPGEKVAIVGENGVGKSTLMKLLLRLYDVDEGIIKVNGKSIKDYDIQQLRKKIGVVFQQNNMYAFSLLENMELYQEIENESAMEIIELLKMQNMMRKNGASLNSEMTKEFSDSGIMLSGGEIQKLGLARIMNKEFGLLILDEPSSALDPISEYEMNQLILSQSMVTTTIIIAHRLSTVRNLDRILVMKDGKIVESGSHTELMSMKGYYFDMFTKQAENYLK